MRIVFTYKWLFIKKNQGWFTVGRYSYLSISKQLFTVSPCLWANTLYSVTNFASPEMFIAVMTIFSFSFIILSFWLSGAFATCIDAGSTLKKCLGTKINNE